MSVGDDGVVPVDERMRTAVPHLHAIGDVTGAPLLAHRAMHQGKVAAEVIAGLPSAFDPLAMPAVAYTDPEVAWAGLTEAQAKEQYGKYERAISATQEANEALRNEIEVIKQVTSLTLPSCRADLLIDSSFR